MRSLIRPKECAMALLGSGILAFGLYHIHSLSGVTEGGVLGMTLLLHHWFGISPSVSGFVMNAACYALGWRLLGKKLHCLFHCGGRRLFRVLCIGRAVSAFMAGPCTAPACCRAGGRVFCGCRRGAGGARRRRTRGDDALAMSICRLTKWNIQWAYLASDLVGLALSASYIPLPRLGYSLLTVLLSGQLIGFVQNIGKNRTVQKDG